MKMCKDDVKSAQKSEVGPDGKKVRKIVGVAEYPEYETLAEAVAKLGEPMILKLTNIQVATNAKNRVRSDAVGEPSEKALYQEACQRLVTSPEGVAKLQAANGDTTAFNALISEIMDEIRKERGLDTADETEASAAV